MPTLKERLSEQMKSSMKSGDKDTLAFVRNLHAAIRKREIDDKVDMDDAAIQKVVATMIKQRQDSIEQFERAGRADLVARESAQLDVLRGYLPQGLSQGEIEALTRAVIAETGAAGAKDMKLVMPALIARAAGRADSRALSETARRLLAAT